MSASWLLDQGIIGKSLPDSITVHLVSGQPSTTQQWLPSLIAIAVVVLGGVIQWAIANRQWKEQRLGLDKQLDAQRVLTERQIDASIRTSARLRWIGDVRKLSSDLLATSHWQMGSLVDLDRWNKSTAGRQEQEVKERSRKLRARMIRRQMRIYRRSQDLYLLLNPQERIEQVLNEAVRKLSDYFSSSVGLVYRGDDLPQELVDSEAALAIKVEFATVEVIQHYWPREASVDNVRNEMKHATS